RSIRPRPSGERRGAVPQRAPASRGHRASASAPWPSRHEARQPFRLATSVAPVALLPPRISIDVVAEALPEPGDLLVHELDPPDPFRALPQIEMRNEEAGRAAMLCLEIRPVESKSDPGLTVHEVL